MERKAETPRTQNREWGFFGTCVSNGHQDAEAAWDEAMAALTDSRGLFQLEAEDARGLLDSTWGRHLADEVVGQDIRAAIEDLASDRRWFKHAREFVRKHIRADAPMAAPPTREQEIASIARRILKIGTLETRNSDALDFHELAVWKIQKALDTAYEAGRQSAASRTGTRHAVGAR